jgi:hypothetical protein
MHNNKNTNDETACKWVSSRGLLKICDKHNKVPDSASRHIDDDLLDNLNEYDVVHICSWLSLSIFMRHHAPKIDKKVIIVTNDSDFDAPIFEKPVGESDYIAKDEIMNFINSDYCVHLFAQNCTLKHPKVSPIPIGLDYHTFTQYSSPLKQEENLNLIRKNAMSVPFYDRIVKCYCNFQFCIENKYYTNERLECLNNVNKDLCVYEPNDILRIITWKNQTNYAFVLSPAGGGYDCHRTWEALILGCIPIVKRFNHPFENLFEHLPVLIVDNWCDITQTLLEKTIEEFKNRKFNYKKLTLEYWKNLIFSYKENKKSKKQKQSKK